MGSTIESAIVLAASKHAEQKDKSGKPYIYHPLTVMLNVDEGDRIAAVLHDIIEDTDITEEDLRRYGISEEDICAIVALSRNEGESNKQYIQRVCINPRATRIKLADIEHNLQLLRLTPSLFTDKLWNNMRMYLMNYAELKTAKKEHERQLFRLGL